MFKCTICGKEFTNVDDYVAHVLKCAEQYKANEVKKKEESVKKAKEVNEYIENIKRYRTQLKSMEDEFAKKYPKEYEMNFSNESEKCTDKNSRFYGSVNGKEINTFEDFLKNLREECGLW